MPVQRRCVTPYSARRVDTARASCCRPAFRWNTDPSGVLMSFRVEGTCDGVSWHVIGEFGDRVSAQEAADQFARDTYYAPTQLQGWCRIVDSTPVAQREPPSACDPPPVGRSSGIDEPKIDAAVDRSLSATLRDIGTSEIAVLTGRANELEITHYEQNRELYDVARKLLPVAPGLGVLHLARVYQQDPDVDCAARVVGREPGIIDLIRGVLENDAAAVSLDALRAVASLEDYSDVIGDHYGDIDASTVRLLANRELLRRGITS